MPTRYTYMATLPYSTGDIPEVEEIDVSVTFTVAWGSPETGAGYMADPYKYDPGSPDEVEDLRLAVVDGRPGVDYGQEVEAMLLQELAQNHTEAMLQEARDREAAWAE